MQSTTTDPTSLSYAAASARILERATKEFIANGPCDGGGIWPRNLGHQMGLNEDEVASILQRMTEDGLLEVRDSRAFILDLPSQHALRVIEEHNLSKQWQRTHPSFYPNEPIRGCIAGTRFRALLTTQAVALTGRWSYAKIKPYAQENHGVWFTSHDGAPRQLVGETKAAFEGRACAIAFTAADNAGRPPRDHDIRLVLGRACCDNPAWWAGCCAPVLAAAIALAEQHQALPVQA